MCFRVVTCLCAPPTFFRWTEVAKQLGIKFTNLIGDVLVSSGVVAYLGAFTAAFRQVNLMIFFSSAWENSRCFTTHHYFPSLPRSRFCQRPLCEETKKACVKDYGFPRERAPEILYWWCVTVHILVERLIGRAAKEIISANQKYLTQIWKVTRH